MPYQQDEWRILLRQKIDEGGDRDSKITLANKIGITERALNRYLAGSSKPDSKKILEGMELAIPEIAPALRVAFPQYYDKVRDSVLRMIAPFYQQVHKASRDLSEHLVMRTVTNMIIGLLVEQLDPSEVGFLAFLAQLRADDGKTKASHLVAHSWSAHGVGTWAQTPTVRSRVIGQESLCALVFKTGFPAFYPRDLNDLPHSDDILYAYRIRSAAAYPILRHGKYAGAIYLASTQSDYFTLYRREIIWNFACMIELAFLDSDYFAKDQIDLDVILTDRTDVEQVYLERLAREFPGETLDQLKERAIARIRRHHSV